ncbi:PAS domain-containing protein [Salisaeta longa]|uniref:PAS domain-containing protein n=1 Tax=Salisaeta longa TaxID=503170 RepID=UPI0003B5B99A|nr:PAS domain-containing protein [Salisaeta longa]
MADQENDTTYPFLDADDDASANDAPADAAGAPADDAAPAADNAPAPEAVTLSFADDDLGEKLRHASAEARNAADFGIIQVDDEGIVQFFNRYESELSGIARDDAEGRNFFTDVAPCTNNRLFRGRFKKGVRRDQLDETFTYTYTYKMRPTLVEVNMYRDEAGNNWFMVKKI